MTQENKDLLLRDLCARLPYGVKVNYNEEICTIDSIGNDSELLLKNNDGEIVPKWEDSLFISIEKCKPYLFPLSSMTEGQTEEVHNLIYQGVSESVEETKEWLKTRKENELRPITLTYILSYKLVIDWFCKNHFDYRELISKGLAVDCTNLNIY